MGDFDKFQLEENKITYKHTEYTKLTDKRTGDKYEIITKGNLDILVNFIHRWKIRKLKKALNIMNGLKINRVKGGNGYDI